MLVHSPSTEGAPHFSQPDFSLTPRPPRNNIEQSIIYEIMPVFDNLPKAAALNRTGDRLQNGGRMQPTA